MTYPPKDYYESDEFRRAQRRDAFWFVVLVALLLALLVAGSARADVRHGTYELRADGPLYREHRAASCGATRFLSERLRLTYDERGARLGVTQLDILADLEDGLVLGKGRPPSKTLLSLAVWQVDDPRQPGKVLSLVGEYVLFGFLDDDRLLSIHARVENNRDPHGRPCEDRVRLVGRRVR